MFIIIKFLYHQNYQQNNSKKFTHHINNLNKRPLFMLPSFEQQYKILGPILSRPSNRYCADCGSTSPTCKYYFLWIIGASLDFGVFLCPNCAGSHRALGPTITRVKSSKLDLWSYDWVNNMKIGNV